MKRKEFKMELLNSEEMKGVAGGAAVGGCAGNVGDVIKCGSVNNYILCATMEVKCTGTVTFQCGPDIGGWMVPCSGTVTIKCKECNCKCAVELDDSTAVVAPLSVPAATADAATVC